MALGLLSWCICISWRKQYIERMEKEQMWWSLDHVRVLWQHSEQLHYSLSVWLLIGCYCANNTVIPYYGLKCIGKRENAILVYLSQVFSFYPFNAICSYSWAATIMWFGQESDVNRRRTLKSLLWNLLGGSNQILKPNQLSRVEKCGKGKRMLHFALTMPANLYSWQSVYTLNKYLICSFP